MCWGLNEDQELGTPNIADSPAPLQVPNLTNVIAITAGPSHACALKADGTIYCWGDNSYGQLTGTPGASTATPQQVPAVSSATTVAAGFGFGCALKADGTSSCWGDNTSGQLGAGDSLPHGAPVVVSQFTRPCSAAGEQCTTNAGCCGGVCSSGVCQPPLACSANFDGGVPCCGPSFVMSNPTAFGFSTY
jgi:hypothetical protein